MVSNDTIVATILSQLTPAIQYNILKNDHWNSILQKPPLERTDPDLDQLCQWVCVRAQNTKLIQTLPVTMFREYCRVVTLRVAQARETLLSQGEESNEFYIIASGSVGIYTSTAKEPAADASVAVKNVKVHTLRAGHGFGELALSAEGGKSPTTIKCLEDCLLVVISREQYKQISVTAGPSSELAGKLRYVESYFPLNSLSSISRTSIAYLLDRASYSKDDIVLKEGANPRRVYFILSGTFQVFVSVVQVTEDRACKQEKDVKPAKFMMPLSILNPGSWFGDEEILEGVNSSYPKENGTNQRSAAESGADTSRLSRGSRISVVCLSNGGAAYSLTEQMYLRYFKGETLGRLSEVSAQKKQLREHQVAVALNSLLEKQASTNLRAGKHGRVRASDVASFASHQAGILKLADVDKGIGTTFSSLPLQPAASRKSQPPVSAQVNGDMNKSNQVPQQINQPASSESIPRYMQTKEEANRIKKRAQIEKLLKERAERDERKKLEEFHGSPNQSAFNKEEDDGDDDDEKKTKKKGGSSFDLLEKAELLINSISGCIVKQKHKSKDAPIKGKDEEEKFTEQVKGLDVLLVLAQNCAEAEMPSVEDTDNVDSECTSTRQLVLNPQFLMSQLSKTFLFSPKSPSSNHAGPTPLLHTAPLQSPARRLSLPASCVDPREILSFRKNVLQQDRQTSLKAAEGHRKSLTSLMASLVSSGPEVSPLESVEVDEENDEGKSNKVDGVIETQQRAIKAATSIQATWRGFCSRKRFMKFLESKWSELIGSPSSRKPPLYEQDKQVAEKAEQLLLGQNLSESILSKTLTRPCTRVAMWQWKQKHEAKSGSEGLKVTTVRSVPETSRKIASPTPHPSFSRPQTAAIPTSNGNVLTVPFWNIAAPDRHLVRPQTSIAEPRPTISELGTDTHRIRKEKKTHLPTPLPNYEVANVTVKFKNLRQVINGRSGVLSTTPKSPTFGGDSDRSLPLISFEESKVASSTSGRISEDVLLEKYENKLLETVKGGSTGRKDLKRGLGSPALQRQLQIMKQYLVIDQERSQYLQPHSPSNMTSVVSTSSHESNPSFRFHSSPEPANTRDVAQAATAPRHTALYFNRSDKYNEYYDDEAGARMVNMLRARPSSSSSSTMSPVTFKDLGCVTRLFPGVTAQGNSSGKRIKGLTHSRTTPVLSTK